MTIQYMARWDPEAQIQRIKKIHGKSKKKNMIEEEKRTVLENEEREREREKYPKELGKYRTWIWKKYSTRYYVIQDKVNGQVGEYHLHSELPLRVAVGQHGLYLAQLILQGPSREYRHLEIINGI